MTGAQSSIAMTLTPSTTLIPWSGSDSAPPAGIAMLIIPQSVLGSGATTAVGIDPAAGSNALLINGDAKNPFGRNLQILANTSGNQNNIAIPPAYPLDTTYKNFVALIRYTGDPVPLTSITFTLIA
jgi:hypothetical protein